MFERNFNCYINDNKMRQIIKNELVDMGYSKDTLVKSDIHEDGKILYYAYDTIRYHGKDTKTISVIDFNKIYNFINSSFNKNSYEVVEVIPIVKNNNVMYKVFYKENNSVLRKSM